MMLGPTEIVAAAAIVFAATIVHASFGFGTALVAMPLLVSRFGLDIATPLVGLCALTTVCIVLSTKRSHADFRAAGLLLTASLFGLPLGLYFIKAVHGPWLEYMLGTVIVAYSGWNLLSHQLPRIESGAVACLCGFLSGLLGGAYNTNAPPVVIYGALAQWDAQKFRATLQGFFLPSAIIICAGHAATGLWTADVFKLLLWSAPAIVGANVLGAYIASKIDPTRYVRTLYCVLIVLGLTMFF